jgi:hypothetical protein
MSSVPESLGQRKLFPLSVGLWVGSYPLGVWHVFPTIHVQQIHRPSVTYFPHYRLSFIHFYESSLSITTLKNNPVDQMWALTSLWQYTYLFKVLWWASTFLWEYTYLHSIYGTLMGLDFPLTILQKLFDGAVVKFQLFYLILQLLLLPYK